jgi:NADP-dependent 3-hydroxy acid dehydrogenase YdfG
MMGGRRCKAKPSSLSAAAREFGFETARQARSAGANVVITARDSQRLGTAARELEAERTEAFDVTDLDRLKRFFSDLPRARCECDALVGYL